MSPLWRERLGEDHTISIEALGAMSDTALTREAEIAFDVSGLPNTFVPGRNILFLAFAAALAYRRKIGAYRRRHVRDRLFRLPGLPRATIRAVEALSLGIDRCFEIVTPLMWIDKAATWRLAEELGGEALVG